MAQILQRFDPAVFDVAIFGDDAILNQPIERWPVVDCLMSWYSAGFPLEKVENYVRLRNPFCINDVSSESLLRDRRCFYEVLQRHGVPTPAHVVVSRDLPAGTTTPDVIETEDAIEVGGIRINKPFVEKPVDAEDHNIYIYYPRRLGGGSKRLFRKTGNVSSRFYPDESHIRRSGSYIYEEFLMTQGTDIKIYIVGPDYAHAEARKSPVVDGIVQRDEEGKEVRFPIMLTNREKDIARRVCLGFRQNVCGFDLLRTPGRSYVCDVNGWSFVKKSNKYYDDAAHMLQTLMLRAVAPERLALSTLMHTSPPAGLTGSRFAHSQQVAFFPQPYAAMRAAAARRTAAAVASGTAAGNLAAAAAARSSSPTQPGEGDGGVGGGAGEEEELRCVLAVVRHGDRTPKQKMKMRVTGDSVSSGSDFIAIHARYSRGSREEAKLKSAQQLQAVLEATRNVIAARSSATSVGSPVNFVVGAAAEVTAEVEEGLEKLIQMKAVLEKGGHFSGINRKVQIKPTAWTTHVMRQRKSAVKSAQPVVDNVDRAPFTMLAGADTATAQGATLPKAVTIDEHDSFADLTSLGDPSQAHTAGGTSATETGGAGPLYGSGLPPRRVDARHGTEPLSPSANFAAASPLDVSMSSPLPPADTNSRESPSVDLMSAATQLQLALAEPAVMSDGVDGADDWESVDVTIVTEALLILKWGGVLTHAGRRQAEILGQRFRSVMYPGESVGLLRLHSTYRHDLKIYSSDEGRVQMTAASFAKGFLDLEGDLTPILASLVKTINTSNLLDDSDPAQDVMNGLKKRLKRALTSSIEASVGAALAAGNITESESDTATIPMSPAVLALAARSNDAQVGSTGGSIMSPTDPQAGIRSSSIDPSPLRLASPTFDENETARTSYPALGATVGGQPSPRYSTQTAIDVTAGSGLSFSASAPATPLLSGVAGGPGWWPPESLTRDALASIVRLPTQQELRDVELQLNAQLVRAIAPTRASALLRALTVIGSRPPAALARLLELIRSLVAQLTTMLEVRRSQVNSSESSQVNALHALVTAGGASTDAFADNSSSRTARPTAVSPGARHYAAVVSPQWHGDKDFELLRSTTSPQRTPGRLMASSGAPDIRLEGNTHATPNIDPGEFHMRRVQLAGYAGDLGLTSAAAATDGLVHNGEQCEAVRSNEAHPIDFAHAGRDSSATLAAEKHGRLDATLHTTLYRVPSIVRRSEAGSHHQMDLMQRHGASGAGSAHAAAVHDRADDVAAVPAYACGSESIWLVRERWHKLEKDLYNTKRNRFDLSKIPDVYDQIKYDCIHNAGLQLKGMHEIHRLSEAFADLVVSQEYGITVPEKKDIAARIAHHLLRKIFFDMTAVAVEDTLDADASGITSENVATVAASAPALTSNVDSVCIAPTIATTTAAALSSPTHRDAQRSGDDSAAPRLGTQTQGLPVGAPAATASRVALVPVTEEAAAAMSQRAVSVAARGSGALAAVAASAGPRSSAPGNVVAAVDLPRDAPAVTALTSLLGPAVQATTVIVAPCLPISSASPALAPVLRRPPSIETSLLAHGDSSIPEPHVAVAEPQADASVDVSAAKLKSHAENSAVAVATGSSSFVSPVTGLIVTLRQHEFASPGQRRPRTKSAPCVCSQERNEHHNPWALSAGEHHFNPAVGPAVAGGHYTTAVGDPLLPGWRRAPSVVPRRGFAFMAAIAPLPAAKVAGAAAAAPTTAREDLPGGVASPAMGATHALRKLSRIPPVPRRDLQQSTTPPATGSPLMGRARRPVTSSAATGAGGAQPDVDDDDGRSTFTAVSSSVATAPSVGGTAPYDRGAQSAGTVLVPGIRARQRAKEAVAAAAAAATAAATAAAATQSINRSSSNRSLATAAVDAGVGCATPLAQLASGSAGGEAAAAEPKPTSNVTAAECEVFGQDMIQQASSIGSLLRSRSSMDDVMPPSPSTSPIPMDDASSSTVPVFTEDSSLDSIAREGVTAMLSPIAIQESGNGGAPAPLTSGLPAVAAAMPVAQAVTLRTRSADSSNVRFDAASGSQPPPTPSTSKISSIMEAIAEDMHNLSETVHQLDARLMEDAGYGEVKTPTRHVRTRLYFTSESHVHALVNTLKYWAFQTQAQQNADVSAESSPQHVGTSGNAAAGSLASSPQTDMSAASGVRHRGSQGGDGGGGNVRLVTPDALAMLDATPELDYLTHVVFRLYENFSVPPGHARRHRLEILFSPGVSFSPFDGAPRAPRIPPQSATATTTVPAEPAAAVALAPPPIPPSDILTEQTSPPRPDMNDATLNLERAGSAAVESAAGDVASATVFSGPRAASVEEREAHTLPVAPVAPLAMSLTLHDFEDVLAEAIYYGAQLGVTREGGAEQHPKLEARERVAAAAAARARASGGDYFSAHHGY